MQTLFNASLAHGLLLVLAMGSTLEGQKVDQQPREQIGEVLGKPIFRDEIRFGKNVSLSGELHRLFIAPVTQQYLQTHRSEISPTSAEISAARKYFDLEHRERLKPHETALRAQLKSIAEQLAQEGLTEQNRKQLTIEKMTVKARLDPPGKSFAAWVLKNWKFQRHLHEQYDGGRILFQQAGLEAFDATRKWLEKLEKDGEFKIRDPELRAALYHYWTKQDHGAFLTNDKQRIREFLAPEWFKESAP